MPYKIKGKSVVKADTGKLVGKSKNPKKYVQVLNMVEHGKKMINNQRKKVMQSRKEVAQTKYVQGRNRERQLMAMGTRAMIGE